MSGIYIPGMEMPKSCHECIYSAWSNFYQIYVCDAVRKKEPVLFDGKQTKSTAVARSARADNCPIIPVPPHGRLIDADALDDILADQSEDAYNRTHTPRSWERALSAMRDYLEDSPTIIPADPVKEEQT